MSVTQTPYQSVEVDLANIHTHQCDFTRGYWIGFAQAVAQHRQRSGFRLRLPAAYLNDLAAALPGWKCRTVAGDRNYFSVEFATVQVEPI